MDDLVDLLLEVLIDGMLHGATSKKVPMPLRILLGAVLIGLFGGLVALLFIIAVQTGSIALLLTAVVVALSSLIWIGSKVRQIQNHAMGRKSR